MKDHNKKYQEAVERNLSSASQKEKYKGMSLQQAKMSIGIRKDDDAYDKLVAELIKKGK